MPRPLDTPTARPQPPIWYGEIHRAVVTCGLTVAHSCAGELPLEIIRLKMKGVVVSLSHNTGFTLPANIGELGEDLRELDLADCSLIGALLCRAQATGLLPTLCVLLCCFRGELPKELGDLVNLSALYANANRLTGEIPSSFGSLVNLKVLALKSNRLSGAQDFQGAQSELRVKKISLFNSLFFSAGKIPKELWKMTSLTTLGLQSNQLSGTNTNMS